MPSELGDDPKKQTKVFYTKDLLDKTSKDLCRIGGLSVEAMRMLHPNRVFSTECAECSDSNNYEFLPKKTKGCKETLPLFLKYNLSACFSPVFINSLILLSVYLV